MRITKEDALFPRINDLIKDIEKMVIMIEGVPTPAPGVNERHDMILEKINQIKNRLNDYLVK